MPSRTTLTRDHLPVSCHFFLLYCRLFCPISVLGKTCYQSSTPEFRVGATPPCLLGGLRPDPPVHWGGEGVAVRLLGEAGRSHSRGPRGKSSPRPHRLGSQVGSAPQPQVSLSGRSQPPVVSRLTPHAQGRGREVIQPGRCDLRWQQEALSDMPGTGTPLQPARPRVCPEGRKWGSLPPSLRATAR